MKMRIRMLILAIVLPGLTACSYIQSFFPDKEKDYRFTTEIPPMIIPEDLQNSAVVSSTPVDTVSDKSSSEILPEQTSRKPETLTDSATPISKSPKAVELNDIPPGYDKDYAAEVDSSSALLPTEAKIMQGSTDAAYILINQSLPRSWLIVGKAITRKSIEITQRNQQEHVFVVQYEPDVKALKDNSIWDNFNFVFGEENNQEREYHIALTAADQQTQIKVLDAENKACTDDKCTKLLTLIQQAIQDSTQKE